MQDAKDKKLFRFELVPETKDIVLDSGRVFTIQHAWVEDSWRFECIDNKAVIVKEPWLQIVIDGEFEHNTSDDDYQIEQKGDSRGCALWGVLYFSYRPGDSVLQFVISKSNSAGFNQRKELAELKFHKAKSE